MRSEARANRRGDDSASSTPGVSPEDGKLSDARRNGSSSGSCVATQEASSSREGSRGDVSPHALPSGASAETERRHAADSASERQTEMMSLLLEECDRMADSANAVVRFQLASAALSCLLSDRVTESFVCPGQECWLVYAV